MVEVKDGKIKDAGQSGYWRPGSRLSEARRGEVLLVLRLSAGGRGSLAEVATTFGLRLDYVSRMAKAAGLHFPAGRRFKKRE